MGLFKSSPKTPPPPMPTLSITISNAPNNDSGARVFKPNDIITGHVTLTTPIPIRPVAVELSFWGMSSVWTRRESTSRNSSGSSSTTYTHYRDNAPLFEIKNNLLGQHSLLPPRYDGERVIENGKEMEMKMDKVNSSSWNQQQFEEGTLVPGSDYVYPFSFVVPEGTGNNRQGFYKADGDERWTILPHALPPSVIFGRSRDIPDNAFIEYGITTRLICPDLYPPPPPSTSIFKRKEKIPDPISDTAIITFAPLNMHATAPVTTVLFQKPHHKLSSSTLSGISPSSLTLSQSLRDQFSKHTPKLVFETSIDIPDYLTSGTPFRFRIAYTTTSTTDNVLAIPPITFDILKMQLLDFTFLRAPRDYQASNSMSGWRFKGVPTSAPQGLYSGGEDTVYREQKTLLNSVPSTQTVSLEEMPAVGEKGDKRVGQARSCEAWFEARVPASTPASFRSFAFSRCYRIMVKIGVEIGGKKFVHEVESVVQSLGSGD